MRATGKGCRGFTFLPPFSPEVVPHPPQARLHSGRAWGSSGSAHFPGSPGGTAARHALTSPWLPCEERGPCRQLAPARLWPSRQGSSDRSLSGTFLHPHETLGQNRPAKLLSVPDPRRLPKGLHQPQEASGSWGHVLRNKGYEAQRQPEPAPGGPPEERVPGRGRGRGSCGSTCRGTLGTAKRPEQLEGRETGEETRWWQVWMAT